MNKAELNKDNRIKRDENHEVLNTIEAAIAKRIRAEYSEEIKALRDENENCYAEEKVFRSNVQELLKSVDITTKLKVVTQVGKGSTILNTYVGHLEKKPEFYPTSFNFISPDRDNELRPFTIGFSCLQSIEII